MRILLVMSIRWKPDDISFGLEDDGTDDPIASLKLSALGVELEIMATVFFESRKIRLMNAHMQGAQPNSVGLANLKIAARVFLERMDFDEIIIEGALRTTGANPGRTPKPLRFTRAV